MKLMPALPESVFDVCYLLFAIISGVLLLKNAKGKREACLFGAMTLILGCVYDKTYEECEQKLNAMIEEVKDRIKAENN